MSFTRQRPLQLSSCAQHQTRHPVPTSRAGKGQVPRPTQCAARAASAESPQQSQHASQIAGTEIAQAAVAHENSALQQQTVADQQGSPGGLLNTFSSSLNPLWELVAGWKLQNRAPDSASSGELLARTAARASQATEQEVAKAKAPAKPVPDISRFIRPAGMLETRYVRLLSSLCAQTYIMDKLTPRSLYRRFRLRLITSSYACERTLSDPPKTASQVFSEGDGMGGSFDAGDSEDDHQPQQQQQQASPSQQSPPDLGRQLAELTAAAEATAATTAALQQQLSPAEQEEIAAALSALSKLSQTDNDPIANTASAAAAILQESQQLKSYSPSADASSVAKHAEKHADPAEATAAALKQPSGRQSGAEPVARKAQKAKAPVSKSTGGVHNAVASKLVAAAAAAAAAAAPLASSLASAGSYPVQAVASQLQSAATAGTSTAVATFATVSAAIATSLGRGEAPRVKLSPVEWFVADEPDTHTRYFVIQGSDNFDHWKVNLTFDPVPFEDVALGVKVHRGVYQTAMALYERFLPLVMEHLASSPFAKISFTGHSLGGSLATLLLMMYLRRGVIPAVATSPAYTFGAPAVFCEGNCSGPDGCPMPDGKPAGTGLLAGLGLPDGAVRNVIMARDIVPRAFACDYTLVADILKRVSPSFRDHRCLSGGSRVALYYSVGRTLVLQPAQSHWFSRGAPNHPMLPAGAGLHILQDEMPLSPPEGAILANWPQVTPAAQSVGEDSEESEEYPMYSPAALESRGASAVLESHPVAGPAAESTQAWASDVATRAAAESTAEVAPEAAAVMGVTPAGTTTTAAGSPAGAASGKAGGRLSTDSADFADLSAASGTSYDFSLLQLDPTPVEKDKARKKPQQKAPVVATARGALSVLMDNPHPLDILGDPAAYGPEGAISRFHNPDNYTAALGGVLRAQPWWTQLLASGRTVSPPACSGPRTFYAAAKDGAQSDQRQREAAARFREQKDAHAPLPPDVPINQVVPYIKPLYPTAVHPGCSPVQ